MSDTLSAETISISGHNGDQIEAYLARPATEAKRGGVVVIHHMPGYDRATKEITRRFAELGYDALMPNLYHREAPGAEPSDAAAKARELGGVPDERLIGDVAAAAAHLRSLGSSNQKVGVIGYCSGGRQSVLAACNVDLQAAVDCYGAFVTHVEGAGDFGRPHIEDQLPNLKCPLLGLFGNDDKYPAPDQVDRLEQLLKQADKPYEFHRYDGAGHAFFNTDRPAYRAEAAQDGWERIERFFKTNLGA
ncbi:MAG: dienelactone hydrolase family protein [Solirubrobacterales bacterium]|nr:dienelactone hydrolase family protein [Solirubrobacterales bacterium]